MAAGHLPALSNAAPFHLVTTSSLAALATALPASSPAALNFRPNLVVETDSAAAWQEDGWKAVRIGSVILDFSLPGHSLISSQPTENQPNKSLSEKKLP